MVHTNLASFYLSYGSGHLLNRMLKFEDVEKVHVLLLYFINCFTPIYLFLYIQLPVTCEVL